MADTRIYIHGRPQGQDIWSPTEDPTDRFYLEPFLGSRIGGDVSSAMIIDLWQTHIYYTYIRCKNVVEKSLRPNAYFAITIRFDDVYTKNVSTLYNLLDQVYNKVCLGNLIANENGQEQFVVSQLSEKSAVLQQVVTIINQNIEKVIAPTFAALSVSSDTNTTVPRMYCLNDVDSPIFIADSLKHRIVVSPYYKSKDKLHEEDLQRLQPLETECAKLQVTLTQLKEKHAVIESEKTKLELELKTVKAACDDLQNQIQKIKTALESKEKELNVAKQQIASLSAEIDRLKKKNPISLPKEPENIKTDDLAQELLRRMAERFPNLDDGVHKRNRTVLSKMSSYCAIGSCVMSLVIIGVLIAFVVLPSITRNDSDSIREEVSVLETRCSELEKRLSLGYSDAKIDISGFCGDKLSIQTEYDCSVKGMNVSVSKWECSDNARFDGNKLMVLTKGDVEISCYDELGVRISNRKINAQ